MKNFRLTTKLFMAIALLFAVVMRTEAVTTLSGSFSSWGEGCSVSGNTITYTTAWKGAGYWLNDIDLSDADYIWVTVEKGSTAAIKMCIQYTGSCVAGASGTSETTVDAGALIIGAKLDPAQKNDVGQFFLQGTTTGSLTITGAYAGTEEEYEAADKATKINYNTPNTLECTDGKIQSSAFNGYSDDAKIEITYTATVTGTQDFTSWGIGKITSLDGTVEYGTNCLSVKNTGENVLTVTLGQIKDLLNAGPDGDGKYGLCFTFWSTSSSDGNSTCVGAFKSLTISEVKDYSGEGYKDPTSVTTYTINFDIDGTTTTQEYAEGATITPPTATKDGYNFTGWDPTVPETMSADYDGNTYTAKFTEDTSIKWSDNLKLEAENTEGYVTASGSGCSQETLSDCTAIQMTDASDLLSFRFNIPEDGKYKVYVRAQGNGGAKVANISINGTTAMFETPESIAEVEAGEFNLSAGQTTVTISPSWTYYYIDYVKLELDDKSLFFNISKTPVTSGATQAALNLYSFLYNNFGAKTISGVMTGDLQVNGSYVTQLADQLDVKAVVTASGKTPELVGFDFMNSTGSGYDSDESYTNTALTLATELWNKGGIPTFTWHWRDPSRTTDSFYKDNGFDFTTAMSNGSWNTSSEVYTKMIADIDKVAAYFKTLENAGVACIFRPLHEPSNGGFWWGAKGAANYVKLYQLIYNEMVNVKGVKNVIWDWNSYYYASSDWCPGSSYYDVASTDIYNSANDNESNYVAFNKMKEQTGATKLLALAECGPIPDITNQVNDEAMWSYWMTWYDTWNSGFVTNYTTSAEWTKVMADDHIIEKDDVSSLANNIVLVDGTAYTATSDQVASSISYTRSCSNEWGTLCLPFAYSSNDDVQYYSLKSGTGSTLVVSPVTSVSAGQPVLFHMLCAEDANSKYQLKVSATNATVTKASSIQTVTPVDGWSIKGTYAGTTILNSGSTYEYYIANNKFWYANNSVTVPAYRAWVEGVSLSSSLSKALTIVIDDDPIEVIPTEIECLQNNTIENVSMNIYNLNGQHLSAPQKGINIINGKKILVK